MFTIDYQIRISDLIVGIGGIIAFVKMFVGTRDVQRDLTALVKELCLRVERIDSRQHEHHDWLVGAGLNRRIHPDRRIK